VLGAEVVVEASDALFDDGLYPRRQRAPVNLRRLRPAVLVIAREIASGLHVAQQLDGKQWVPAGALIQRGPEIGAQAVIDEVKRSGLKGRGGAAFPTGVKWEATQ